MLNSERAITVNIEIMGAFVKLRELLASKHRACALLRLESGVDCFEVHMNYLDRGGLHVRGARSLFALWAELFALSEIAD